MHGRCVFPLVNALRPTYSMVLLCTAIGETQPPGSHNHHTSLDIHCECPYKLYDEPHWITWPITRHWYYGHWHHTLCAAVHVCGKVTR